MALAALLPSLALGAAIDRSLEPFDPRADYGYELAATAAAAHPVELTEGGFDWPPGVAGDTAFLELYLERARQEQPGIRLRHGEVELHQVFEDGARGRRFVDVSPFLRAGTIPREGMP